MPAERRPAPRPNRARAHKPAAIHIDCLPAFLVPGAPVALDQRDRGRAPSCRRYTGFGGCGERLPGLADRVDPAPGRLDLVAAHEQRLVAADHDVHQQALIGVGVADAEGLGEAHVERHMLEPHAAGARLLDHQPELDALVGLQADNQPVGGMAAGAAVEDRVRNGWKATSISETRCGRRLPVRR